MQTMVRCRPRIAAGAVALALLACTSACQNEPTDDIGVYNTCGVNVQASASSFTNDLSWHDIAAGERRYVRSVFEGFETLYVSIRARNSAPARTLTVMHADLKAAPLVTKGKGPLAKEKKYADLEYAITEEQCSQLAP